MKVMASRTALAPLALAALGAEDRTREPLGSEFRANCAIMGGKTVPVSSQARNIEYKRLSLR